MRVIRLILIFALALFVRQPLASAADKPAALPDNQHGWDFNIGTWKTHIRRLKNPLTGSNAWTEINGIVSVRKIWNGRANLEEIEGQAASGSFEGLTLRLYNPSTHEWNLYWANANGGTLTSPMIGGFRNGRGEFYGQDTSNGKAVLVRQIFDRITDKSYHFEQSFSADGTRTWEPNFVADLTRLSNNPAPQSLSADDRNHDFDFNLGTFNTHVSRLRNPLSGSDQWVQYDGTSLITPVWNGRASIFELEVDGTAGHIEGVGLRLFNPESHQWNLNWANSAGGRLGVPTVGEFKQRGGEFVDQEPFNDRQIFVRNAFSNITADSSHFEQAFSADGGKTWETNWIMTFTRKK